MAKESQRININIRGSSPCKDCTERFTACSDRCPKDQRGEYGYKGGLAALLFIILCAFTIRNIWRDKKDGK